MAFSCNKLRNCMCQSIQGRDVKDGERILAFKHASSGQDYGNEMYTRVAQQR